MNLHERYLVEREKSKERRKRKELLRTKIPLEDLKICELSVYCMEPRNIKVPFEIYGRECLVIITGRLNIISKSGKILLHNPYGLYYDPIESKEYSSCYPVEMEEGEERTIVTDYAKFPRELSKTGEEGYVTMAELMELNKSDLTELAEEKIREKHKLIREFGFE